MTMINTPSSSRSQNLPASQSGVTRQKNLGVNVADTERSISVAIGSIAIAKGLMRFSLPGMVIAGIGAALVNRGLSGHCGVYSELGINTADSK